MTNRSKTITGRFTSLLLAVGLCAGQLIFPAPAFAQAAPPDPEIITNSDTGLAKFIWYPSSETDLSTGQTSATGVEASAFLNTYGGLFGLSDVENELVQLNAAETLTGSLIRYQQTQQGYPVLGGELVLDVDHSGNIRSASGETTPAQETSFTSALSSDDATQLAIRAVIEKYSDFSLTADHLIAAAAAQVVYDSQLISNQIAPVKALVWMVTVTQAAEQGSLEETVLLDAVTGEVLLQYSASANALPVRTIYDCADTGICATVLYKGTTTPPPVSLDPEAIKAINDLDSAYLYFQEVLGRNGINGANGALNVRINYAPDSIDPIPSSLWANGSIYLASGYVAADIIAHEYTHGIIASTSRLINFDQSAVIAEGLGDVFSVFVDQYDNAGDTFNPFTAGSWQIGETITGGPLRDIATDSGVQSTALDEYYCTYTPEDYYDNSNVITLLARRLMEDGETPQDISRLFYNTMIRLTSAADLQDFYYVLKAEAAKLSLTLDDSILDSTELYLQPCRELRGEILPRATTLMEPINAAIVNATNNLVTLKWRDKADVEEYYLKVSSSLRGAPAQFNMWLDRSTVCADGICEQEIDLLAGEKITWAVQTRNAVGTGPFTRSAVFTRAPSATTGGFSNLEAAPVSPLDDSVVASARPGFSWEYRPAYPGGLFPQFYELSIYRLSGLTRTLFLRTVVKTSACSLEDESAGVYHQCNLSAISKNLPPNTDFVWNITAKFGRSPLPVVSGDETFSSPPLPFLSTGLAYVANTSSPLQPLQPLLEWTYDPGVTPEPEQWKFFTLFVSGPGGRLTRTLNIDGDISCPVSTGTAHKCTFSFEDEDLFLEGGLHTWTVQAGNAFGRSAIVKGPAFTLPKPSTAPDLTITEVNTWRPLFTWTGDPAATSYLIIVSGPTPLSRVLKTADVCDADRTDCSFKMNATLRGGNYSATVRAQNKAGSLTGSPTTFSLGVPPAVPAAPVLLTPALNTLIAQPETVTLTWTPNTALTPAEAQYQLNLSGPGFKRSYLIDGAACAGTCTWTETGEVINFGKYTWTVNTLDRGVIGPVSLARTFTLVYPAPVLNALNPIQNVFETPVSWAPVSGATSYRVTLKQTDLVPVKTVWTRTNSSARVCQPSTGCSILLPAMLPAAVYQVEVTPLGPRGTGLTASAPFTAASYRWDDFNSATAPTNWTLPADDGTWKQAVNLKNWTGSIPRQSAAIYTTESTFTSPIALNPGGFEVVTALNRIGCTACEHGIHVNLNLETYTFAVNALGQFKIDTPDPAVASPQPWTYNSAVKRGTAFNTLRVRGEGNTLSFFVNNRLVWQHTDLPNFSAAAPLDAGVYMISDGKAANTVAVDWFRVFGAPE